MPLSKIEARTAQGAMLPLSLTNPDLGFKVRNVDGLDPVKANIVSSSQALLDAEQYQSSRRVTRNIVIKIGVEPDWITTSVQDLRDMLYDFFMPKNQSFQRYFRDGKNPVDIMGYVEDFSFPLFTADPEATISLICLDSDFVDSVMITLSLGTVPTALQYPLDYEGNIETGFVFTLRVNRSIPGFTLYNSPADGSLHQLVFLYPLVNGDIVQISTVNGNKYVTLTRSGVVTDILYAMSPSSDWIQLFKGVNNFRAFVDGGSIPFDLTYQNRYGGL